LSTLLSELQGRHERAAQALRDALQGDRYRSLLAELRRRVEDPELTDEAWESCRTALPPKAVEAWRPLKKGARGLDPSDPDEKFHEVRKRAKRARYTAELIAPVLGRRGAKGVRRFIRRMIQIQDALGRHQDAVVAGRAIEEQLAVQAGDPHFVAAAGHLLETLSDEARLGRAAFFKVWEKLDQKKSLRWMEVATKAKS
jgi:CHAD domain-containing protein